MDRGLGETRLSGSICRRLSREIYQLDRKGADPSGLQSDQAKMLAALLRDKPSADRCCIIRMQCSSDNADLERFLPYT